ncbi:alpha/beta fold hydrolase [Leifsonia aquatica]|uniref:Hydrolase, alpha/beta domain protein n=2 Tax=Leifsonia aquatica TaxID=144185 RepID=U2TE23_LEIAQ|nr:alpha/beta fold hydrolase [Leifsonia aquatica]ERK72937.1 hydrolase, alpha/beta domain protein [Leifsonia aquatica ATCC 14665]MBB2965664.1 3-oxoadipate enol-lactonase [Leifsonia aquatica]
MPTTDVGATRVNWRRGGAGDSVVLLHGLGGDIGFWDAELPALERDFDVIALDLRGSGATPSSAGGHEISDLADDVVAVLDDAGVARAHVVGFSMGGLVAQALALRHPGRLNRLVLASTYATMGHQARLFLDAVLDVYENGATATQMFELICPWLFSPAFVQDPANRAFFELPEGAADDQSMEDWRALYRAQRNFDVTEELSRISAPTLVVSGARDALVPAADALALRDGIAGARLEVFAESGHLVNVEDPARFIGSIRDFLRA